MLRPGHALALLVIALMVYGIVMVNSAGLSVDPAQRITVEDVLLSKHTVLAVLSIAALITGACLPVDRLFTARGGRSAIPWLILAIVVTAIAAYVPGIGVTVNGANRWVGFGPLRFQASEIAKWGVPIILAWWCARHAGSLHRFGRGLIPPLVLIGLVFLLNFTEDLGTSLLISAVGVAMLLAGGCRARHVALLGGPAAIALVTAAIIMSPYRLHRITSVWNPYADATGRSYHVIQSMQSVSGGGLAGRGLGNSVQKFGYLPEDTTDFLFAIVCEELGLVGAAVLMCLYAGILFCAMRIIAASTTPFRRLLALGITLTIGLQASINLLVVTGLAPTKGIALPLLSAGGTGWVLTAFSVGLLIAMDRANGEAVDDVTEDANLPAATLQGA
ncbi:MAG: cell division protein FtsW [Phycisphaerales bacterium]|nr:cell division protein FtsW [Phycisphaerales bacterium]